MDPARRPELPQTLMMQVSIPLASVEGTDRLLAARASRPRRRPPGPRLRNWWGSSALVITDSRVSFSDARICVTASPYVARQSCSMWARPWTCHLLLRADNCDLHHITK